MTANDGGSEVNFKRYTGKELHGFMFPDYSADEPRWIDAKNVSVVEALALINGLAARDCTHDEPNCGCCLSCRAKTILNRKARDLSSQISVHRSAPGSQSDAAAEPPA